MNVKNASQSLSIKKLGCSFEGAYVLIVEKSSPKRDISSSICRLTSHEDWAMLQHSCYLNTRWKLFKYILETIKIYVGNYLIIRGKLSKYVLETIKIYVGNLSKYMLE